MLNDENVHTNVPTAKIAGKGKSGKGKTIEETYTKLSQLEHILKRPDTYIGSIEKLTQAMWVFDRENKQMVNKQCSFVPGLYKIFDEILVNAADNKQRDASMNRIEVTINEQENFIRVWNNGNGIPIVMHQEHKIYVPELIFGNLLTGSNFDDEEAKTTGGRNGFGAKLANIFSTKFVVETADTGRGQKYHQVFTNNMKDKSEPTISKIASGSHDYTCITFYPDLKRFNMDCLDEDIVSLLSKRVYDIAGTNTAGGAKLNVYLNGTRIDTKTFESYMGIYQGVEDPIAFERVGDRWEIGVAVSDGSFQQVSYVNSICTTKGGCHVNYIVDQITSRLAGVVKKKNKGEEVKPNQIKNHLSVFVNALIVNPAFDSQTKENLTTKANAFGSTCIVSDKMMKAIEKSDIIDNILNWSKFKQTAELKKKSGTKRCKLTGIPKLDDANCAGTSKSSQCTLILTEGDSAKALAISGLGVVGRDFYGVFPLKGKLLNVREASHTQIMKNEEIQNISKILGLTFGKEYTDASSLRYGHLMIMTDQDHDGSHIKGLLINFLHHFWPSLLKIEGFLQQFITPIVKCTKGKKEKTFFTIPQYENWRTENGEARGWHIKYYKGLGTSTAAEAKEYFSNLPTHEIDFEWDDRAADMIDMAFAKKRVEDRKLWLLSMEVGTHIDYDVDRISYDNFVNKELILFSQADNERSISHFMDGLKPSQRKVLYSCFKRNLKTEIKVAQLAGYISEHSAYHHGEASLTQTIIGMAQNYIGSNNINLLSPCGQFGTRLMGGKDAASPRYVFTKLEAITRKIFHPHDDAILEYQEDDGQPIEPVHYVPVVPMALINGSDGIGTGWSSNIPTYNPREIINNLKRMLNGDEPEEMKPWYRGFSGDVVAKTGRDAGNFTVLGAIEQIDESTLVISELPTGKWTTDYKQFLETILIGSASAATAGAAGADGTPTCVPFVKDFKENHTDTTVLFTLTVAPEKIAEICNEKGGLMKKFKLEGSVATSNMNMFDLNQQIRKFEGPAQVMKEFFTVRLQYYDMRKLNLAKKLTEEWEKLDNKMRFVLAVIKGEIVVSNRKKQDLMADLKKQGFKCFIEKKAGDKEDDASVDSDDAEEDVSAKGYDYLLSMKIWSLTMERVQDLNSQLKIKRGELDELLATTAETLWLNDLDALEIALDDFEAAVDDEKKQEVAARKKAAHNLKGKNGKSGSSKSGKKSKKHGSDDEDSDEEDADSEFEAKPRKAAPTKAKPAAPKPVAAAAAAPAPAKVQSTLIKFMTNTDKPEVVSAKSAPKAAAAAVVKKPVASAAVITERRAEDVRENMSLAERIAAARAASGATLAAAAAPVAPIFTAAAAKSKPKAAPKKKASKVMDLCSDAESNEEEDASEDDIFKDRGAFKTTITASRAPRAVAQKKTTYAVDSDLEDSEEEDAEAEFDEHTADEDDDSDAFEDSEDDVPKKSNAKKAAAAAKSAPKAASKPAGAAKKSAPAPAVEVSRPMVIASPPSKSAPAKGVKRSNKTAVDSLLSIAREVYSPGAVSPQPAKKSRSLMAKAAPKAPKAVKAPAATKAPAAKKSAASAPVAAKKSSKKAADLSEDEEFDEEVVHVSRSPKPVRARKTLKYVEESEEEEDFIDDSEADEESDFCDEE